MSVSVYVAINPVSQEFDSDLSVNMSNTNAAMLFRDMGIDITEDWCGGMEADAFIGHLLVAMALADDSGIPGVQYGNVYDCGIDPGYKAERLAQMHEVAQEAKRLGREVVWA